VVVALRRDLDEINSALKKDEKLKILENYICQEALSAEKKRKTNSVALECYRNEC
jgi:hypothetical protein